MSKTRIQRRQSMQSKKSKRYTKTTKFLPKIKSVQRTNSQNSHLVKVFFEMLNMVKLYHWKTHSYAQHKATDELYTKLNEHIDRFIEVLLGKLNKSNDRIKMMEKRIDLIDSNNVKDFKSRMFEYREFLIDFNMHFDSKEDSDLLNIRDEILADVNQFLYLMSFDK